MIFGVNYKFLLLISTLIVLLGCERLLNEQPVADFIINPGFGDVETVFLFDAGISADTETETWRLKVRWDADSDGEWDSEYSIEKKFAYQFSSEGDHYMTLEVLDSYGGITQIKKTILVAPVIVDSFMTDPRDNQVYRTVRLWGKWYMSENLRYGVLLNEGEFPTDNMQTDVFQYNSDSSKSDLYGYFYTYNEATEYRRNMEQGVCPDGWHIIDYEEINELNIILLKIYNRNDFLGEGGILHLDIPRSGRLFFPTGDWNHQEFKGYFWINYELPYPRHSSWAYYNGRDTLISRNDYLNVSWVNHWEMEWGEYSFQKIALPVRCVKD